MGDDCCFTAAFFGQQKQDAFFGQQKQDVMKWSKVSLELQLKVHLQFIDLLE